MALWKAAYSKASDALPRFGSRQCSRRAGKSGQPFCTPIRFYSLPVASDRWPPASMRPQPFMGAVPPEQVGDGDVRPELQAAPVLGGTAGVGQTGRVEDQASSLAPSTLRRGIRFQGQIAELVKIRSLGLMSVTIRSSSRPCACTLARLATREVAVTNCTA